MPTSTAATSPQLGSNILPIAVGVVVGLAITLVLLCVGVIVIVWCLHKNKGEDWKPKKIVNTLQHNGFDNAVYASELLDVVFDIQCRNYHTASTKPLTSSIRYSIVTRLMSIHNTRSYKIGTVCQDNFYCS